MSTDAVSMGTSTLSHRATIAQLSLQLRASLHEADAAEAQEAGLDPDAELAKLRARVGRVIEARRSALDEELDEARATAAAAAAAVAAVRRQAAAESEASTTVDAVPAINVVMDAEAFARVMGTVLGEYLASSGPGAFGVLAGPAPQPSKREARTPVRALDVLLSGLAALILLVIVAAWLA
jgi:hypothetical protein